MHEIANVNFTFASFFRNVCVEKKCKKPKKNPKKTPIFTHYSKRSRFDQIYLLFDNNSIAWLNIIHKTCIELKRDEKIKKLSRAIKTNIEGGES